MRSAFKRRVGIGAVAGVAITGTVLFATPAHALPGDGLVTNFVGNQMSSAFSLSAASMVVWVLEAVGFFANGIFNFLKTSARPEVDSIWFSGPDSPYAAVREIAIVMLLGFVLLGVINGLIKGDVAGMLTRMGGTLPAAMIGMVISTTVVAKLLDLTDAFSTAVLSNSDGQALHFLSGFGATANIYTHGFAALMIGMFAVIATFILWVELIVRSSLIYFLVALSPLAFAATLWPATKGILRRLVELTMAVILSKLVICIALSVGVAALSGAGTPAPDAGVGDALAASLGTLLSGTVVLVLAAWAPFLLMRMIPFVESTVVAQGISRAPMRTAQTAMNASSYANSVTRLAGNKPALSPSQRNFQSKRLAKKSPLPDFVRNLPKAPQATKGTKS